MLTVIQQPFNLGYLAWIAYVPLIIVAIREEKTLRLVIFAYIISFAYWLGNLYYIIPVTISGWAAFCAYTAILSPILILTLRFLRKKFPKIPSFLLFAILLTAAERLQGFLLGGFAWRMLAHSQYENIRLIQIADIFGAGGVSFIVAAVNGQIAEIIMEFIKYRKTKNFSPVKIYAYSVVVIFLVIASVVYGTWRIEQYETTPKDSISFASVQSNIPQSVKISSDNEFEILHHLLEQSKQAQQVKPDLIIFPETMVQGMLNHSLLSLISDSHLYCRLNKTLKEYAKGNSYLLVGAMTGIPKVESNSQITLIKKYNSAYLYTPDGIQSPQRYDKIHLVPFGEFIPFRKSCPAIYNFFMKFSPYDYDYSIDAGDEYTIFTVKTNKTEQNYKFGVMICYEDTVAEIARNLVIDKNGNKKSDFLVNISNDGWFTKFENEKIIPSAELAQHTVVGLFRAIENRISIIRSVNTGISCAVDPLGRIKKGYETGNLPENPMKRRGIAGWFADNLPIYRKITLFSLYGRWLDNFCAVILTIGFVWSLIAKRKRTT
jgi:apolipoprotein N-acyltransferase